MNRVFLLTGSNLGDSLNLLKEAAESIGEMPGNVIKKSHIYRSQSWGYKSAKVFYNQCIELETNLNVNEILDSILEIESEMGRVRIGNGYSDRLIDIDILFSGDEILENECLNIPHPRLHLRKFALVPMNELAPGFIHPVLKKTIEQLLRDCEDESDVFIDQSFS